VTLFCLAWSPLETLATVKAASTATVDTDTTKEEEGGEDVSSELIISGDSTIKAASPIDVIMNELLLLTERCCCQLGGLSLDLFVWRLWTSLDVVKHQHVQNTNQPTPRLLLPLP